MKKIVVCFAVLGAAIVSCKKAEPATPAEPGTSTISGSVKAPLDLSNDTTDAGFYIENLNPENVTSGKITVVVDSKDLDNTPDPDYDYQKLIYTVNVENGMYSIVVPAISTPLSVEIYGDEFTAAQRQYVPGDPDSFVSQDKKFSFNPITVDGVINGVTIIQNINYSFE